MKITYLGNFNDIKCEGLITITRDLRGHFSKHINSINTLKKDSQLIHIHSSGFYESIKYRKIKFKKVYSLHSNIKNNFFKLIKNYCDYYSHIGSFWVGNHNKKDRLMKTVMALLSNITPIFIKRYFLNKMDLVIVPNKLTYNSLKLKNSQIIHQGINTQKFKPYKKINNKLKIRYFGHPTTSKGLIDVIHSFNLLKNYETELFLTKLNPKLKKYVKKHSPKTKVHGLTKNIVQEYNNSNIIILPYIHTGGAIATPLVLIEAMACECAIITTNLPHLKEICGDSVIYVNPHSVNDIVKKVNFLANNPKLRKELGRKARARVVKYYNQEKMFKEYEKLYNKIASSS